MTYQVLARKWRPHDFDSVVGQSAIVKALRNALKDGRIAQAYLFSGIRGVGKTSVARVLAKALNCENGPENGPCNNCSACNEITKGADFDVQEVDAATFSKVEQIRELTESLKYGPARDRYKVVVLDEVHRLSRQAFDALLKIVEEPPAHLVFIFATTEIDAVPATILSRCQEFNFRRVPLPEMVAHLRRLAVAEEIDVSDQGLRLIARAGEGSVRDSVALLDQLATFGSGAIEDSDALALLGGIDLAVFGDLLGAILGADRLAVLDVVKMVDEQGWDARTVYSQFLSYCRDALHLAAGGASEHLDLSQDEIDNMTALAEPARYEDLLRMIHLLLESESSIRHSDSGSLPLEIAWLRAAELPRLIAIEAVLAGQPPPEAGAPKAAPSSLVSRAQTSSRSSSSGATAPPQAKRSTEKKATAAAKAPKPARARPQQARPAQPEPVAESEPDLVAGPMEPSEDELNELLAQPAPLPAPAAAAPVAQATQAAPNPSQEPSQEQSPDATKRLFHALSKARQPLAARIGSASNFILHEDRLEILTTSAASLEKALARPVNRSGLEEALEQSLGKTLRWTLTERRPSEQESTQSAPGTQAPTDDICQDPKVQAVLDLFGGEIESID